MRHFTPELTWMLLFLLLQASPAQRQGPQTPVGASYLIVQVVDPAWLPTPGIKVTFRPLDGKGQSESKRTDKGGNAKFLIPMDGDYIIEAKYPGFKNNLKRVYLFSRGETAYVQLQLSLSGPGTLVY